MQNLDSEVAFASKYISQVAKLVEEKFEEHLPPLQDAPQKLHEAMRYSMFAGGKRLRPVLAYASFELFNGKDDSIWYATSALEMLHTFSLIHDDLPSIDNDDFRRGKKTAHIKFGEATAILAGDALCILAFELIAKTENVKVIQTLARALGTYGMIGGEITDVEYEGKEANLEIVNYIHYHKTAALIEASLVVGAQLAKASEQDIQAIQEFGKAIGLAFQIVDDILDIVSVTEVLGKDAGSDVERGKATYPAVIGLEASKIKARELYDEAISILEKIPYDTTLFKSIAAYIITRVN